MTAASGPWAGKEIGRSRWNGNGLSGADGNRNHDLFDANEALYQLSYSPVDVVVLRMTTRYTLIRPFSKRKSACVSCRIGVSRRRGVAIRMRRRPRERTATLTGAFASQPVHELALVCGLRRYEVVLRRDSYVTGRFLTDCDAECMCGVAIRKGTKPDMRIATLEDGFASQSVREPASVCGLRQ